MVPKLWSPWHGFIPDDIGIELQSVRDSCTAYNRHELTRTQWWVHGCTKNLQTAHSILIFHIHIPPLYLQGTYPQEIKVHMHKKTCLRPCRESILWHSVSTTHLVESLGNHCCVPPGISGKTFPYSGKPWELWTNKHITPLMDSKNNSIIDGL